jgi:hypothetical protein
VIQEFTNSELGTFRTCRARHGFEYIDLLRPRLPASVLTWGNCIHAGLEAGYLGAYVEGWDGRTDSTRVERALQAGDQGVRDYYAKYLEQLDELVRDGHLDHERAQERFEDAAKLLDVALWAVGHFFEATRSDLEGPLVPLGFEVPIRVPMYNRAGRPTGKHVYAGKVDAVWWDPEARAVLIDDHKTVSELVGTTERRIALDPQMSGYMHGVLHMVKTGELEPMDGSKLPAGAHERVGSCRYNVIRRSRPKQPKINKVRKNDGMHMQTADLMQLELSTGQPQGLVSTAAIDTTAEVYEEALVEQTGVRDLPTTDKQRELLAKLKGQGDRYFARFEFWRNAEERERWRREVLAEARLMRWAERDPEMRTRNAGACSGAATMPCTYRAVCLDDQPETRALYRVATTKHEEVGDHGSKHEG